MARVVRSAVFGRVVCLCVVVALVVGCTALPKLETAVFQDPLLEHKGTVPLKAAMMTLTDARPAEERQGRGAIEAFAERVTVVMLTDLSEARVFTSIERAKTERAAADVILRGEIRSFRWSPRYNLPPFIPGLGILAAFGVPVSVATTDVEITLELVDPKKAQTVVSYTKAARERQSHFVYRFQDFQAGSDRDSNSALRRVAVDLQMAILEDRQQIVEALK
jgi:hypothetical protein